jgi:hypothetical protein
LNLEAAVPDRSLFSKNRHGRLRESALFLLQRFVIDASVIEPTPAEAAKRDQHCHKANAPMQSLKNSPRIALAAIRVYRWLRLRSRLS